MVADIGDEMDSAGEKGVAPVLVGRGDVVEGTIEGGEAKRPEKHDNTKAAPQSRDESCFEVCPARNNKENYEGTEEMSREKKERKNQKPLGCSPSRKPHLVQRSTM